MIPATSWHLSRSLLARPNYCCCFDLLAAQTAALRRACPPSAHEAVERGSSSWFVRMMKSVRFEMFMQLVNMR